MGNVNEQIAILIDELEKKNKQQDRLAKVENILLSLTITLLVVTIILTLITFISL